MSLKLITFDSTGTLITVRGSVGERYAHAAREQGLEADENLLDEQFLIAFSKVNRAKPNFGFPSLHGKDWWREVVLQTFSGAGLDHGDMNNVFEALYDEFSRSEGWDCYPETREVIQELRGAGYKLGIISNFDERLPLIYEDLGMDDLFDFIVVSRDAGFEKPSPKIFQYALTAVGVYASEALHIGDSKSRDYYGALSAGMKAVFIDREGSEKDEDLTVIQDLRELPDVVKKESSG